MGSVVKDPTYVAYISDAQTWKNPLPRKQKLRKGYGPWVVVPAITRALVARGIPEERAADTAQVAEDRLGRWVVRDGFRVKIVLTHTKMHLPH